MFHTFTSFLLHTYEWNKLGGMMMRNRLILCLLICAVLLYYAVPRLTIHFSGLDGIFAFSWFLLALFVIGGNLVGILYGTKKAKS